ncbi:sensor histidine kinase [Antarcticibacterium arcticum]|uniref:Sensor histidine kinase n=1 Tax=Antarcticibacterium arcticum TaxID=2585771 RepID=A0A5B8YR50_9FLAO|nr:histidine kinase [Antarcticibacterium arcticum]QED38976.1 sensor histidine kinase [Antarcticibacterium arcticum]
MGKTLKRLGLHILFWILIVLYFAWGFGLDLNPMQSIRNALFFIPGHLIIVYGVLYFLVPKFLLNRKYWQFFLGLFILIGACGIYTVLAQLSLSGDPNLQGANITVGRNILPFIHVAAIAASIKLLKFWYVQRKHTLEAEQQRTVAELKLLKAQLHPHFLFNTLNNLYSHTLEFSPKSPEIVLRLSALLRFMIYESNSHRISLDREINLLENYISLEKMRYGERLDLSLYVAGEIEKYQIAPLLLLPFVENAFKHGTSRQIDQCWISLDLSLEGSLLKFKLINSIDPVTKDGGSQRGGLGLDNVKKRLEILYKGEYKLETQKLPDVYVVNLEIQLEILEEQYIDKLELSKII